MARLGRSQPFPPIIRQQSAPPSAPVGEDSWHQPFTDPTANFAARLRAVLAVAIVASGAFSSVFTPTTPETITADKWHQSWQQPVRRAYRPPSAGLIQSPFVPSTEVVTVDKWFSPFGEVTRARGFKPYLQSSTTIDPRALTLAEQVTEDRWHQPFSDPTAAWADLRLTRHQIAQVASGMAPGGQGATIAPEVVTADKWYVALSEWPRSPKGLKSYLQPSFTVDPWALTQPETIYLDRWYSPFSVPVRPLPTTSRFPTTFDTINFSSTVITVYPDSWYVALTQPTRPRANPSLIGAQLSLAPFQEAMPDSWWNPLSDPVRRKPYNQPLYITDTPYLQPILTSQWYSPFSIPTRIRPRPHGGIFNVPNTNTAPAPISIVGQTYLRASKVTITLLGSKPVTILVGGKAPTQLRGSKTTTILLGGKSPINLKGEVER